jgi:hypothetical protein
VFCSIWVPFVGIVFHYLHKQVWTKISWSTVVIMTMKEIMCVESLNSFLLMFSVFLGVCVCVCVCVGFSVINFIYSCK